MYLGTVKLGSNYIPNYCIDLAIGLKNVCIASNPITDHARLSMPLIIKPSLLPNVSPNAGHEPLPKAGAERTL
jgi:hypothetical protein